MVDQVSHSGLTGNQVHEPKGIETATLGQWYVTDGAGSGSWQRNDKEALVSHTFSHGAYRFIVDSELLLVTMDNVELVAPTDYIYLEVDGVKDPSFRVYFSNPAITYSDKSVIVDYSVIAGKSTLLKGKAIGLGHSLSSVETLSTTSSTFH